MVKGKCKKKRRATCVMRAKFCFTNLHGGSTVMHGEESALIEEVEYKQDMTESNHHGSRLFPYSVLSKQRKLTKIFTVYRQQNNPQLDSLYTSSLTRNQVHI
jgi:hypothetical protein